MRAFLSISLIAVRELLHERIFYILLAFAVVGVAFSTALAQLTYSDQAKLSLDFMLAGAEISLVLLSVFVGVGLFQREMASGSIAMVLSKPISRSTFLLGKFSGQMVIQFAVASVLAVLTLLARMGEGGMDAGVVRALIQAFYLAYLESVIMAGATYFLATFCGPLTTGTVALSLFFLGHFRKTFELTNDGGWLWSLAGKLIPFLDVFNAKAFAAYGLAVSGEELAWITVYAGVCGAMFLVAAIMVFRERDIPT